MTGFSRFVLVGAIAAVANWLSRIAMSTVLELTLSIILAYAVGIAVAYSLNRQLVFSSSAPVAPELSRFLVVNLISLLIVIAVTHTIAAAVLPRLGITEHADALAHAIGVASPVLFSYFCHSLYTFRVQKGPQ